MGNPRRGRDSHGRLKKMHEPDRMARGTARMARAQRRGNEAFLARVIAGGKPGRNGQRK